jgi:hypothetical protein
VTDPAYSGVFGASGCSGIVTTAVSGSTLTVMAVAAQAAVAPEKSARSR